MPKVDRYNLFPITGWPKGFVRNADHFKLFQDELFVAQNFKLDARGELVARNGYVQYSQNILTPVVGLASWTKNDGTDFMLAVEDDGTIWYDEGLDGTFVDSAKNIGTESSHRDFGHSWASAGDKLYASSLHVTNPHSFDGTTWAANTAIGPYKTLLYRHERLFAGNNTTYSQRIVFSDAGDAETFPAANYIDVNPQDGDPIMHMVEYGDNIIIFKEHSIWQLTGRTPATFQLYQLDNQRGTVSPKSVVVHNGLLYFFDRSSGVWEYNGASFKFLSESINEYMLEQIYYTEAYNAAGYVEEERYYLGVTTGSSGNVAPASFVFSLITQGWTEYTTRHLDSVKYLNVRYNCGQARADDQTAITAIDYVDEIWDLTTNVNAVQPSPVPSGSVETIMETGWIQLGGPGSSARVRRVEFKLEGADNRAFQVEMFRDFDDTNVYVNRANLEIGVLSYTGPTAGVQFDTGERIIALDGWGNRVSVIKFRFTGSRMHLSDFHIFYTGGFPHGSPNIRGERHSTGVGGDAVGGCG